MRIVSVAGLAALVLGAVAPNAAADIGPRDPARQACTGLAEGAACTIDGKAGTCHGPHPSRMSCDPGQPPSQGSGSAAAATTGSAAAVADPAAGSAQAAAPASPDPAPTPGRKRGCAVADPGSATLVGLALAVLGWRRRRRPRSMP
jgi:MYXO-CTERM domain-containing protein